MSSDTKITQTRESRLDDLLLQLGAAELAIIAGKDQNDWLMVKAMETQKAKYLNKIRRISYGLPEDDPIQRHSESS